MLVIVAGRVKGADEGETHRIRDVLREFLRVVRLDQGAFEICVDHERANEHVFVILEFHDRSLLRKLQDRSSVLNQFVALPHVTLVLIRMDHLFAVEAHLFTTSSGVFVVVKQAVKVLDVDIVGMVFVFDSE